MLRTGLADLLGLLAEVVTTATYPSREVTGERNRLAERLSIARSQPSVLVGEALQRRLSGDHPYARELPTVEAVTAVTPGQLRRLHADRVRPDGSVLVLVGDLSPARALDAVGEGAGAVDRRRPRPAGAAAAAGRRRSRCCWSTGPARCRPRSGSAARRCRRDAADYPALQLANLAFGGYFSSRW